jgi:hypothetical protein
MKCLPLILIALCALAAPLAAQDTEFHAVVERFTGFEDGFIIELPNGDLGAVAVGSKFPAGTRITTDVDCTMILNLEGESEGVTFREAILSIAQLTDALIDKMFVRGPSVTTRVALQNGEVALKITQERADYATDMKVATPTTTASITGTGGAVSHSANFGTQVTLFSGSMQAQNQNGQVRNVTEGTTLGEGDDSTLANNLNSSSSNNAPIGSVSYEVTAGQLSFVGSQRSGSDANNPRTNPSGARRNDLAAISSRYNLGDTLPAQSGRAK